MFGVKGIINCLRGVFMEVGWDYKHFGIFGLDASKEAISFYIDGENIVYEIDDKSVSYDGIPAYTLRAGALLVDFANAKINEPVLMDIMQKAESIYPKRGPEHYKYLVGLLCNVVSPVAARAIAYQFYGSDKIKDFYFFMTMALNQAEYCIDKREVYMENWARFDSYIGRLKGTGKVGIYYVAYGFNDIVTFDVYQTLQSETIVKRCALCGRAFIPASRSDEMYCHNIYKNNRTCAQIAFEVNSKKDGFYSAYRKAYQAKHARAARKGYSEREKSRLKKWAGLARVAMEEYQEQGNLPGFLAWLEANKE